MRAVRREEPLEKGGGGGEGPRAPRGAGVRACRPPVTRLVHGDGGGALGSLVTSSVEAAVPSPPSALSKVLVMCCLLGRE